MWCWRVRSRIFWSQSFCKPLKTTKDGNFMQKFTFPSQKPSNSQMFATILLYSLKNLFILFLLFCKVLVRTLFRRQYSISLSSHVFVDRFYSFSTPLPSLKPSAQLIQTALVVYRNALPRGWPTCPWAAPSSIFHLCEFICFTETHVVSYFGVKYVIQCPDGLLFIDLEGSMTFLDPFAHAEQVSLIGSHSLSCFLKNLESWDRTQAKVPDRGLRTIPIW